MFIYLFILLTVILKICALPYFRPLIENITENGLRLSSVQHLLQGGQSSSSSRSSASIPSDELADQIVDQRQSKVQPVADADQDFPEFPASRSAFQNVHRDKKRAMEYDQSSGKVAWGEEVPTDSTGTDNKYKGTKDHILQALKESMEKSLCSVNASGNLLAGKAQPEQVYGAIILQDSPLRNLKKSKTTLDGTDTCSAKNQEDPSPLNDESSLYHDCNPTSSDTNN